jgi:[citrate (pro-3S)-lyase] ligase
VIKVVIKRALLALEIEKVSLFLQENGLKYDADITETLYIEQDNTVIASISRSAYLIKCLAVRENRRGENLAGTILSELLSNMRLEGLNYYQVYTKSTYIPSFESMGFRLLANSGHVAILEAGESRIDDKMEEIKEAVEKHINASVFNKNIGAIVVNCNPMTKGHYQLILDSAKKHDVFLVFVVEEDQSFFNYEERFAFVHNALMAYPNIMVLPSTKYMVSQLTFPSYFLKTIDEAEYEHALLDAIIFRDHFVKKLNIAKRYIGSEVEAVMVAYNKILKDQLKDLIVEQKRFTLGNETISASLVRKLIFENRIEEAVKYIPEPNQTLFNEIAGKKYNEYKRSNS